MVTMSKFFVARSKRQPHDQKVTNWRLFLCTGNHLYRVEQHFSTQSLAWDKAKLFVNNELALQFQEYQMWDRGSDVSYLQDLTFYGVAGPVSMHLMAFGVDFFEFLTSVKEDTPISVENSGGHCEYYHCEVVHPQNPNQDVPYIANCEDIIQALGLTFDEGCEFKSLWRRGRGRQGFVKAESSPVRDAAKAVHYAQRVLAFEQRKEGQA